jgi:phosphatidylinositol alpha-1,6-mannosyltransferase
MTQAPSLLALVGDAFGGRGGIAQYNRDFLTALSESGAVASVTVLPRLAPDPPSPPVTIRQLSPHLRRSVYSLAALRSALSRRFDIVFCGHVFMASLALKVARLKHSKLIIQTHGIEAWPKPSRFQQKALEAADLVLSVSRYTRGAVLKWASISPDRVVVVPNTVRDIFVPGDDGGIRSALGLQNKRVLLTVARLNSQDSYKGHDRVIAALPQLIAGGHDIVYLVAGEGHERIRLEGVALRTVGPDRVRFLGAVDLQTLVKLYRTADLFVLASSGEGFGIAFLEAMACGTPALGLGIGGATDALADGELGAVVTEAQLAATIVRLLGKPKSDPGRLSAAVHARFSREMFTTRVCSTLNRLVEVA